MEWRLLVVDDQMAQDVVELVEEHKVMTAPDRISCKTCADFDSALEILARERFDLVVLDLKDEGEGEGEGEEQDAYAGEVIYQKLKTLRFMPVVFHTGFAHKVKHLESPFVKVVVKGDDPKDLRTAIKQAFDTKLPKLIRHIEEEQRKFMWESAEKIWANDLDKSEAVDLVYLLARRLANLLSGDVVKKYLETDTTSAAPKSDKIHAVELYVWPPMSEEFLFGDIFKKKNGEHEDFFVALTPSCDHAQRKADFILFGRCKSLKKTEQWNKVQTALNQSAEPSKTAKNDVMDLLLDKSKPLDRFKYLPGTSFVPDLVLDLQDTLSIDQQKLKSGDAGYERVASLDSPFAESLQGKLTRYFGRIGTPDLDGDLAFERLKKKA